MSKISLIIPVYRVENLLAECVESVLNQTYGDFEAILVDDGSPDSSPAKCDEFAILDSRIVVIHQNNYRTAVARNRGIEFALSTLASEWLTFVDSDDIIHPQYLELLYRAVDDLKAPVSIAHMTKGDFDKSPIDGFNYHLDTPDNVWTEYFSDCAGPCVKLFKKGLFQSIRFPAGKLYEDLFVMPEVLFANDHVALIDATLYYYRLRENSATTSEWFPEKIDQIDAYHGQVEFFKERQCQRAMMRSMQRELISLSCQIEAAKKSKKGNKYLIRDLVHRLRRGIKAYCPTLKWGVYDHESVYYSAWPLKTQCIMIVWSICQTIKTEGLHGVYKKIKNKL